MVTQKKTITVLKQKEGPLPYTAIAWTISCPVVQYTSYLYKVQSTPDIRSIESTILSLIIIPQSYRMSMAWHSSTRGTQVRMSESLIPIVISIPVPFPAQSIQMNYLCV